MCHVLPIPVTSPTRSCLAATSSALVASGVAASRAGCGGRQSGLAVVELALDCSEQAVDGVVDEPAAGVRFDMLHVDPDDQDAGLGHPRSARVDAPEALGHLQCGPLVVVGEAAERQLELDLSLVRLAVAGPEGDRALFVDDDLSDGHSCSFPRERES